MIAARRIALAAAFALLTACGGSPNTPSGPVVGSGGGDPGPGPTHIVKVQVKVTIPGRSSGNVRPDYVSSNTESIVIQLVSVNGGGVTGIDATTIDTVGKAPGCVGDNGGVICSASASGSPGLDVFSVTTYAGTHATGSVLSVGTVQAQIGSGGGSVPITNRISLTLYGVIASLKLALLPNSAKRGEKMTAAVTLNAFDASGAQIVGPSDYDAPIALSVQGDTDGSFALHDGKTSGSLLSIPKPTSVLTLAYDGNGEASPVTVQAAVSPGSASANASFGLRGKQPPPPVGTIYALNLGAGSGRGATVTEYDGKSSGNAAPKLTLQLSPKLYARGIAVDSSGNLYVGYLDTSFGFAPSNGTPDAKNEVAIYAPGASGNAQPTTVLIADKSSKTALFPVYMAFDAAGDFVTYGATSVDGNTGDAVLTYPPGSKGAATPAHGWNFASPQVRYAGPTGLALDSNGNFYVNGSLHTALGPSDGLFVAAASDAGNPSANPARTIPWDAKTQLPPGLTTNVALDSSAEIFIANSLIGGGGGSYTCQGRVNVFAAGATGGTTDRKPLRVLTLEGLVTNNPYCSSPRDPRVAFFPSATVYGTTLFVSDDFNNAISAFPANARGAVKPTLQIAGSATGLNAPIAIVVTSVSGQAKARPVTGISHVPDRTQAHPFDALQAQE